MKDKIIKIFNHYGIKSQLKHFNGEVFELNEAILLYDVDNIAEEIADVMNMLRGIQYHYDITDEHVSEIMNYKLDRQLMRIEEELNGSSN